MNHNRTAELHDAKLDVKVVLSGLWIAMLFVFAYVDIFGFFRADVINGALAGKVSAFEINQTFLVFATVYILIPSLMVFLSLILRPRVNRIANIALSVMYALTIIAASIGEWNYYILGSATEVMALAAIVYYSWTWPREALPTAMP